jgi:hypothetical protein
MKKCAIYRFAIEELFMNWDWLPVALMLGGFLALWVLILPRLKSGG